MISANKKIEDFLQKNKGIIIKMARKSLGTCFNENEAMSIAYLAGLQAKVYKRDQFQKTKDTTVFVWYLKKGFDAIRGFDGGERKIEGKEPAYYEESRAIDFGRISLHSDESDDSGYSRYVKWPSHGLEPSTGAETEFHVCIKSFNDKAISKKMLDTLRLLTLRSNPSPGIDELERMYKCKRKDLLSSKILNHLLCEINAMGLTIYKAECMNGTCSIVIACAASREEAYSYFAEYGRVLNCSRLVTNENLESGH